MKPAKTGVPQGLGVWLIMKGCMKQEKIEYLMLQQHMKPVKKKKRVWRVVRSLCTARKDGAFDAAAAHEARKKTVLLKAR